MRKLITVILSLICVIGLTACNGLPFGEKEPEPFVPVPMSISGTVESITDNYVNIVNETFELSKVQFETVPEDLHIGTIVDISAETTEMGEYFTGVSYNIAYQPLQYILGYTAEELISNQNIYSSALYQIKEGIGADATFKGRVTPFNWTNSITLRNDRYTRHITKICASILDEVRVSDVYEEYATQHDTIMKYINYNFGMWYSQEVESYQMDTDISFNADTVDIVIYEMKDDVNVNVEFVWDFINDDNVLASYIKSSADKFGFGTETLSVYVSAEYNTETKDLRNIVMDITGYGDASFDEVPLSITSYQITVYGVEYNEEIEDLFVPQTVIDTAVDIYYLDNPMEELPDFRKEDLLCVSLLGKEQVMVNDILEATGYKDDMTIMRWGIKSHELCLALKEWLNNYNTDTFMQEYVTLDQTAQNEQLISAGIIYSWLQPYGVREQEYAPAPEE